MLYVFFCIVYSVVCYLNVSFSRLITSVVVERAGFSAFLLFLFKGVFFSSAGLRDAALFQCDILCAFYITIFLSFIDKLHKGFKYHYSKLNKYRAYLSLSLVVYMTLTSLCNILYIKSFFFNICSKTKTERPR